MRRDESYESHSHAWARERVDHGMVDDQRSSIVDFPTSSEDDWFRPTQALSWAEAATRLGVTVSVLRRALDRARRSAGDRPLVVHGVCAERGFRAERASSRRGVPWRFRLNGDAARVDAGVALLRSRLAPELLVASQSGRARMLAKLRSLIVRLEPRAG